MKTCPLQDWLDADTTRTQTALSGAASVSQADVSDFVRGLGGFSPAGYLKVSEVTGVPVADLLLWEAKSRARRSAARAAARSAPTRTKRRVKRAS